MTQTMHILRAILRGARTSHEIARSIGARRGNVSVALHRLSDEGLVERAGVINTDRIGRPYVWWRLRAGANAPRSVISAPARAASNTAASE